MCCFLWTVREVACIFCQIMLDVCFKLTKVMQGILCSLANTYVSVGCNTMIDTMILLFYFLEMFVVKNVP